jgi:hypothetical protein
MLEAPFTGTTDLGRVRKDFGSAAQPGPRKLWEGLRSETEETLGRIPDRSTFGNRILPFLEDVHASRAGGVPADRMSTRIPYEVDQRLAAAGLQRPRGAGRRLKGVTDEKTGVVTTQAGSIDLDQAVLEMIDVGDYDGAIDALYTMVENVARLTPANFANQAAEVGSIFYPIRQARNAELANALNLPKRFIDTLTSINSAQAGPFIEMTRTLSLLPFLRMASGKLSFDRAAAEKTLGKAYLRAPGINNAIKAIERGQLSNPDTLNQIILGIGNKTYPYNLMAMDSGNIGALVNDTIGTSARAGRAAQMASDPVTSLLGQVPERAVAQVLDIQNSALQEIDWFISRILRGESASAIPFERLATPRQMFDLTSGRRMISPNVGDFSRSAQGRTVVHKTHGPEYAPSDAEISRALDAYTSGRGTLVDPEVMSFLNDTYKAFDLSVESAVAKKSSGAKLTADERNLTAIYDVVSGKVVANRESLDAVLHPKHRKKVGPLLQSAVSAIKTLPQVERNQAASRLAGLIAMLTSAAVMEQAARPAAIERMAQ